MYDTKGKIVCFLFGIAFGVMGWNFADTGHNYLAGLCMFATVWYAGRITEL